MTLFIKFVLNNIPIRQFATKWSSSVHTFTEVMYVQTGGGGRTLGPHTGNHSARVHSVSVVKQNPTADVIKFPQLD